MRFTLYTMSSSPKIHRSNSFLGVWIVLCLLDGVVVGGQHVSDSDIDLCQHVVLFIDLSESLINERNLRHAHLLEVVQFRVVWYLAGRIARFLKRAVYLQGKFIEESFRCVVNFRARTQVEK